MATTADTLRAAWGFIRARFALGSRLGLGLTGALVTVGGLFWAFAEIIEAWTEQDDLAHLDAVAYRWARAVAHPALTAFLEAATWMGSVWVVVPLVLGLAAWLIWRQRGRGVLLLGLVMGPGQALVYLLKVFFARARPDGPLVHAEGFSFPSGHSFTACAFYGLLILWLWRPAWGGSRWSVGLRVGLTVGLVVLILLVGASRIYLGVHYFTDVVGGFVLALGWLLAMATLLEVLRRPADAEARDTSGVERVA